jgi:hypothetical protein
MKFTEEQLAGKFLIGFDTICEGHQTSKDEDGNPDPQLYDSYNEAFKELFIDAVCGIEGNEEHLEDEEAREKMIADMKALIEEGDVEKMKAYMEANPDSNYYEDFVQEADQFILGRKAIFTGNGVNIEGTKLKDHE